MLDGDHIEWGPAVSDRDWMQRGKDAVNKLYGTLGIDNGQDIAERYHQALLNSLPYGVVYMLKIEIEERKNKMADKKKELAKEYGCDLTFDEIFEDYKKEEEKNKMADKKEVYRFVIKNVNAHNYEIVIEKDFTNYENPYHINVYYFKEKYINRIFSSKFGYHYWEQLETQLMYDLAANGIVISQDYRDEVTRELHRAKNVFRGCVYANVESPYQGGYVHTTIPEIMEFKNGKDITLRKAKPFELMPKIEKVIFNPPATIVKWKDGTKTVVKCKDDDEFDWEKGLAMAYVKRAFNNERTYYGLFKKNEPWMNLPNSNVKYDPDLSKEVRIIVPKDLPVTGDIIMKAHDLIMKEGDKKWENGITLGQ